MMLARALLQLKCGACEWLRGCGFARVRVTPRGPAWVLSHADLSAPFSPYRSVLFEAQVHVD
jgi:hypothetical protein